MKDIIGQALLDYHLGHYTEDLITQTDISFEDVLPLPYLFRSIEQMPAIEKLALDHCRGSVLDVGCGAGVHGLYLEQKGFRVTAIDTSPGAVSVARERGIKNVRRAELLDFSDGPFDTILLLMNGTGIFGTLDQAPEYLSHLRSLLHPDGQVIIDSSDLIYMYDRTEEGGVMVPADRYYGQLYFTISYKGQHSEPFPWLYLHMELLAQLARESGLGFELLAQGDNYDYLARLFRMPDTEPINESR